MPDEPPMKERLCLRFRCFRLPETAEAGFPDIRLGASVSIKLARSEGAQEAVMGERAQNAKGYLAMACMPAAWRAVQSPLQCVSRRTDGRSASAS
jgi:hypothetical protein